MGLCPSRASRKYFSGIKLCQKKINDKHTHTLCQQEYYTCFRVSWYHTIPVLSKESPVQCHKWWILSAHWTEPITFCFVCATKTKASVSSHRWLPRTPKKPFKHLQEKLSIFGEIQNKFILGKKHQAICNASINCISKRCV